MKSTTLFVTLCAVLLGCSQDPVAPIVPVPPDLLTAPLQIVVGSSAVHLEAALWRDFQPPVEQRTPLLARLQIKAATGSVLAAGLRVERAWVILNDSAWQSVPRQESATTDPSVLDLMSRDGPEWPLGAAVTAVVKLRDANNAPLLLRSSPEKIIATL